MTRRAHHFSLSILGLIGAGLLAAGALGPWLDFPLSSSLYPKDLLIPAPGPGMVSLQSMLLGIGLLAGIGWLSGSRLLMLIAGLTVAMLLIYFLHGWMLDDQWLPRYLSESEQREAVQAFLSEYYWPNFNPEPTVTLETDFEYLTDQLRVFWYSSGWGFGFCLIGMILLLLDCLMVTPAAGLKSLGILLLVGSAVMLLFFPLFNAELKQRHGDELLASGRLREAISAFETSLRMNPALQDSKRFLLKTSRAYYQLEGDDSLLGGYYLASSRTRWVIDKSLSQGAKLALERSVKILTFVLGSDYQGNLLETAILRRSAEEYRKIRIQQGLDAYAEGEPSRSMNFFREALNADRKQLHAGFLLAHVQRELGLIPDAVSTLGEMLQLVEQDSIRADLLCTLGDAYSREQQPLPAREAYARCFQADSLYNFRAVFNLGGT
jgi:tetratricopeptide (TPR) repeat protein